MNTPLLDAVAVRFGAKWFAEPLFYAQDVSLRFELAQGDFWIDRLETATLRGKTIAEDAIGTRGAPSLLVAQPIDGYTMTDSEFRLLAEACAAYGLPAAADLDSHVVRPASGQESCMWLGATSIEPTEIRRVVWAAAASDLGPLPRFNGRLFLLNASRDVLVHPYDDRGLDVVSDAREKLRHLFDRYGPWLLDHDRERMGQLFNG